MGEGCVQETFSGVLQNLKGKREGIKLPPYITIKKKNELTKKLYP